MSVRSKFEAQLGPGLRQTGFEIKIPDCSRAYKPFDYVLGIPTEKCLRFVAIEAKRAVGWTLGNSAILPHQERALNLVESLQENSSWLAIGFLDIPRMKRDHTGRRIAENRKREAFIISWHDYLAARGKTSISYGDIVAIENSALEWAKIGKRYMWTIPKNHYLFSVW